MVAQPLQLGPDNLHGLLHPALTIPVVKTLYGKDLALAHSRKPLAPRPIRATATVTTNATAATAINASIPFSPLR